MFKWLHNLFGFYRLGFGGGGGSGTNTTKWEPMEELRGYHAPVVDAAAELMQQPYNPYPYARVADLNPTQLRGLQWTADLAASSSPELNAARNVTLNTLTGGYQNPMYGLQTQVGQNPMTSATATTGVNPMAAQYTSVGNNPFIPMDNPYLQTMIQSGQRNLADAYRYATAPQTDAAFALQHGYGGSAYDTAVKRNQDQLTQALQGVEQQYGFPAYQQSSQLYENALNRSLGAQQSDLSRIGSMYESALGRDLQAQLSDLSRLSSLYESGIDRGVQAQTSDMTRNASLWEAERARQMGMIPQALQNYQNELGQAQAMVGVGDVFQQQEQNLLNDLAAEWQRSQSYPQAQLDSFLNTLIRASGGFGTNTSTTTTANQVNPASAILGSALLGYGLYNTPR